MLFEHHPIQHIINLTKVFPIHRPVCGAAPQNQHQGPQIDSAFFPQRNFEI